MDSDKLITCTCGEQNEAVAFRCRGCGRLFDGGDGHSIPISRQVSLRQPQPGEVVAGPVALPRGRRFISVREAPGVGLQATPVRSALKVAVVTFNDDATVRVAPTEAVDVPLFTLKPCGATNEVAGLEAAAELGRQHAPQDRLNILVFSDGEPNEGAGWFGDDKEAALEKARGLKSHGARIATVGFVGTTVDLDHLRALASSPALAWEAQAGTVVPAFLNASQSLSQRSGNQTGREFIVFVIDESGSMDEGNKRQEVERAVNASIDFLKTR